MSELKNYQDKSVLEAARERTHYVFNEFDHVYLSVSGGKDSSVMLQLMTRIARQRDDDPEFDVLFVDLEAQYSGTISHFTELIDTYQDALNRVYWVCLPLSLRNAVSQIQPKWTCWDRAERDKWVRDLPDHDCILTEDDHPFDFYEQQMEFEDFIDGFSQWYAEDHGGITASGVAIRSNESLNRFRSLVSDTKQRYDGKNWTTQIRIGEEYIPVYSVFILYDWTVEDVWGYVSKEDLPYNEVYEQLWKNGVPLSQQRICQPFGDDQRNGLDQFRCIEPETWENVLNRVSGVNFGNIYARTSLLGNFDSEKPEHLSWEEYAVFLLESVGLYSPMLRDHYTDKITTFIDWYENNAYPDREPPWTEEMGREDFSDEHPDHTPKQKWPSWERIAWAIERNDFWMKRLGFSQTKGGREKLERLEDKYGDSLLHKEAKDDKHLREWKEEVDA